MKTMRVTVIALWACAILTIASCKQLDSIDGIKTDPKTGAVTQTTPNTVTTIASAASNIPVYGNIIQAVLLLVGGIYAKFRIGQANGNTAAALGAASATAAGIGSVVATLPADIQAKVATALDIANDAAGVAQVLQDSLQATATGHPASVAAPIVPAATVSA